ncbi:MAG: hypothetical protein HQK54_08710 [Oligoflexales bacterium]|nr:hypothetical protein [Oligoflexales bacterium]
MAADFVNASKENMVLFVNFMGVKSETSVVNRLQAGIEELYAKATPVKSWLESAAKYFKNISATITVDPISGQPSFSLQGGLGQKPLKIAQLFSALKSLAAKYHLFIIFDEFQDIAFSPEIVAVLRTELQEFTDTAIGILGSRRDMLEEMFGSLRSPFYEYGDEYHLPPIACTDWLPYFNARLASVQSNIAMESVELLADIMCDVPNAICEAGAWMLDHCQGENITPKLLIAKLDELICDKEQSLRFQISLLSEAEKSVFQEIAHRKYVDQLTSKEFLQKVKTSASATRKIFARLNGRGFLEWEFEKGYRISNPMIRYFLLRKPM